MLDKDLRKASVHVGKTKSIRYALSATIKLSASEALHFKVSREAPLLCSRFLLAPDEFAPAT